MDARIHFPHPVSQAHLGYTVLATSSARAHWRPDAGRDLEQQQTLTTVCCHVPKVTSLAASTGHRFLLQINQ
jgi:hypothetical protein